MRGIGGRTLDADDKRDLLLDAAERVFGRLGYARTTMAALAAEARVTRPTVYAYYPHAFSANLVNDVDSAKLSASRARLTASVKAGDVLMAHADYWQANNPTVVQIFHDAGVIEESPASVPARDSTSAPAPPPHTTRPFTNSGRAVISGRIRAPGVGTRCCETDTAFK